MEGTQFTYFQQIGGCDCTPVAGEITYGLERLAMYIQGVDRVYDLKYNDEGVTYGDVFLESEKQFSAYNFEHARTDFLFDQFREAQEQCKIGRAHVRTPVTNANIVCSLLLDKKKKR